jgi:Trypsin-like peptidase domain
MFGAGHGQGRRMTWESRFIAASRGFDWQAVAALANDYVQYLRSTSDAVPPVQAKSILALLRENRRYNELLRVADALLGHGVDEAAVKRQFAQALVDRETPAASLLIFRTLVNDPGITAAERAEAQGGVGRCYKQMYVLHAAGERRSRYLQLALAAYREAYEQNRDRLWHGINVVALLARADGDGIGLLDFADAGAAARTIARDILDRVAADPDPDAWDEAIAIEACLALRSHDEAVEWAARFAADPDADPFKIASVLRQLIEIWQLDTFRPPGDVLLPILRSALLKLEGGTVSVATHDVRRARIAEPPDPGLEKVLGTVRFQSLTWYRTGLARCRAVARVENAFEDGIGTGFLMEGPTLHPALPPTVFVTNGHVIPEDLPPRDAVIVFRGLDSDVGSRQQFRIRRSWWYERSQSPGLDTTLLELDGQPDDVTPVPLSARLPNLDATDPPRAYLIGHPRGLAQPQFTMQDNVLLDYDDQVVHYRSPTEPGSSGSPVFDSQWKLIALHHAGGFDTPRLNNKGGTYAANEGISLRAILSGLQNRPPRPEEIVS